MELRRIEATRTGAELFARLRGSITAITERLWGDLPTGDLEDMLRIFTETGQGQSAPRAGQASLQVDQFGEEHAVHTEGVFGAKNHDHIAAAVFVDQTGDFRAQFFEPIFVYLGAQ